MFLCSYVMIRITDDIALDEKDLNFKYIRSPGPGGQHVNKAATAVQLGFDLEHAALPETVRSRLRQLARNRINARGILIINANRFRSQDLNRKDALARLAAFIVESLYTKKSRRRTKPTLSSVKKNREIKKKRSRLKRSRKPVSRHENDS